MVTLIVASCDICGDKYEMKMGGSSPLQLVGWSLEKQYFEFDMDDKCRPKIASMTLGDLSEISRMVAAPKRVYTARGPDKAKPKWDVFKDDAGVYRCPWKTPDGGTCGLAKRTGRGIAQHHNTAHGMPITSEMYPQFA